MFETDAETTISELSVSTVTVGYMEPQGRRSGCSLLFPSIYNKTVYIK